MEMLSTKQKLLFFRWIAVRCTSVTLCLAVIIFPAQAEQVPSIPASVTTPVPIGWVSLVYSSSLLPSADAVCNLSCDILPSLFSNCHVAGSCTYLGGGLSCQQCAKTAIPTGRTFTGKEALQYVGCPTGFDLSPTGLDGAGTATGYICTCTSDPATGKSCVTNQCPSVAAGETPFKLDPGGATCSRPDKLSIELEEISTVEPSKARSIKATVKGPDGPQGGVAVTVILDVKATSGGHDHGESFDVRPRGGLSGATACPSTAPPRSVCATGATSNTAPNVGVAMFTFTAPAPAGTHTFTATCKECTNTATASVDVKVEGLVQIPDSIFYTLIEADGKTVIGATTNHGKNHYLTHGAAQKLQLMAIFYRYNPEFWLLKDAYKGQNLNGKKNLNTHMYPPPLHLNDASLVWGGVFDISGKWGPAHEEHRRGTVIDVRANEQTGKISLDSFDEFKKMAKKNLSSDAHIHCTSNKKDGQAREAPTCIGKNGTSDNNRHFHIRLLGAKE